MGLARNGQIGPGEHRAEGNVADDRDPIPPHRKPGEQGRRNRIEIDQVDQKPEHCANEQGHAEAHATSTIELASRSELPLASISLGQGPSKR